MLPKLPEPAGMLALHGWEGLMVNGGDTGLPRSRFATPVLSFRCSTPYPALL